MFAFTGLVLDGERREIGKVGTVKSRLVPSPHNSSVRILEPMTSKGKELSRSLLGTDEILEDDSESFQLANELRGMYKNRLKEMEDVDERREEAHKVRGSLLTKTYVC